LVEAPSLVLQLLRKAIFAYGGGGFKSFATRIERRA